MTNFYITKAELINIQISSNYIYKFTYKVYLDRYNFMGLVNYLTYNPNSIFFINNKHLVSSKGSISIFEPDQQEFYIEIQTSFTLTLSDNLYLNGYLLPDS